MSTPPDPPGAPAGPGAALPSFDELVNGLLGLPAEGKPLQVRGMPLAEVLNAHAHELFYRAAKRVHEDGSRNVSAEHLLWAATKVDPARSLFLEVSIDPDVIASETGKVLPLPADDAAKPARRGLGSDAARIIGTAHARARATGSSLVGPEHILDALLNEPDAGVAAILDDGSVDVARLGMLTGRDELRLRDDGDGIENPRDEEREDR